MALHRDIHWIGRQWAVTGFGMQAIDQRHGGHFDIEVADLWNDELLTWLSEQHWFNADDFNKGLEIARRRYPEPPRAVEPQVEREPEPAPEPEPISEPVVEPAPVPLPLIVSPPPLPANELSEPAKAAGPLEPQAPGAEPAKPAPAAQPEDLLSKWFEAYGLDKTAPAPPVPETLHQAALPAQVFDAVERAEPVATALEPTQRVLPEDNPAPELPPDDSAGSAPASSLMHMPVTARARFVRPWRVPIRAVQSYRL